MRMELGQSSGMHFRDLTRPEEILLFNTKQFLFNKIMTDVHIFIKSYVQSYVVNGPVWMLQQCILQLALQASGGDKYFPR